jgi:hypothetical protein
LNQSESFGAYGARKIHAERNRQGKNVARCTPVIRCTTAVVVPGRRPASISA